mgnify:CR=1 FL=1
MARLYTSKRGKAGSKKPLSQNPPSWLKYGAKEELMPLLRIRNIGRVRARLLSRNGIKNLGDLSRADLAKVSQLLGPAIAKDIKSQIGEEIEEVKTGKRKGQKSVDDYQYRTRKEIIFLIFRLIEYPAD